MMGPSSLKNFINNTNNLMTFIVEIFLFKYKSYLPPGMFKSICIIKIENFPFDEQHCELKFGR